MGSQLTIISDVMEKYIQLAEDASKDPLRTLDNVQHEPSIGFDIVDLLKTEISMMVLSEEDRVDVLKNAKATASALLREGTGETALRLLARDIVLRRLAVAQADGLVALCRERMKRDDLYNVNLLTAASKDAEREHRKLLAALDAFARYSAPVTPNLHVSGGPNYVLVKGGNDAPK